MSRTAIDIDTYRQFQFSNSNAQSYSWESTQKNPIVCESHISFRREQMIRVSGKFNIGDL